MIRLRREVALRAGSGSTGPTQDHRITTRIDVSDFHVRPHGALRAHATQVDPTEAWWFGVDDDELAAAYPWEDWILARSLVGPIPADDDETRPVRRRPGPARTSVER